MTAKVPLIITKHCLDAIRAAAIHDFRSEAHELDDGQWEIDVTQETFDRLYDLSQDGRMSPSDVILKLLKGTQS